MAEEKTEEQKREEQVQRLKAWVQDAAKESFEAYRAEFDSKQGERNQDHQPDQTKDPVGEMINEYTSPMLRRLSLQDAAIDDRVNFYEENRDIDPEIRTEVEDHFKKLFDAGRPTSRADIYDYLVGQRIRKDPEAFVNAQLQKREAQRAEAEANADAGAFGFGKVKDSAGRLADPESLSQEELAKALEGTVF